MKRYAIFVCVALQAACAPFGDRAPRQDLPVQPPLAGKVWLSTDASAARGTIRVFLPDGTLLMDSCGETYRLAAWRALDDRRIEWTEDTVRIEAQIARLTEDELHLRLQLRGGAIKDETYRLAKVPAVCPDMPR